MNPSNIPVAQEDRTTALENANRAITALVDEARAQADKAEYILTYDHDRTTERRADVAILRGRIKLLQAEHLVRMLPQ